MQQNQGPNQQQDNQEDIAETEDEGIGVGTSKQSKIMIIIFVTVFVSGVIYFMFLKEPPENAEGEVNTDVLITEGVGEPPVREDRPLDQNIFDPGIDNSFGGPQTQLTVPPVPEVPELPADIKDQIAGAIGKQEETFTKDEVEEMISQRVKEAMEKQMEMFANQQQQQQQQEQPKQPSGIAIPLPQQPQQQPQQNKDDLDLESLYNADADKKPQVIPGLEDLTNQGLSDEEIIVKQQQQEAENLAKIQKQRALQERRAAPIFKMSGGDGPSNSLPQDSDAIILSYTDAKLDIQSKAPDVLPTQVTDLTRVILQGKVISAVLETAVDTDLASTVRAVITRDVYAEEGKNILIPRGSRVIGTYSTAVTSGQTRVTINWNRIIRVDGMSLNIASIGADRLGRAGVQGDLDNRYVQQLANSFLSSVLSVGTSLVAEKLSGSTGITSTVSSLTGETTTTSGKASDYALIDATQQFMDDAKQIVDDIAEQKPVIRIPQGEKIVIMVTQDVTLPIFKRGK